MMYNPSHLAILGEEDSAILPYSPFASAHLMFEETSGLLYETTLGKGLGIVDTNLGKRIAVVGPFEGRRFGAPDGFDAPCVVGGRIFLKRKDGTVLALRHP
jgi:hypothetical protein